MAGAELEHTVALLIGRKWSVRRIAREVGASRNTIQRIADRLEEARERGHSVLPAPPLQRASLLDKYEPFLRDLLDRHPDATGVRVLEELQKEGFTGGYTIVKDWLRRERPEPKEEPTERIETEPGEQGQQDWSPYEIPFTHAPTAVVQTFSLILSFSRRHYIRFCEHADYYTLIRQHQAAFDRFRGVPRAILYDRQKAVVLRREHGRDLYNPRFLAFATHYGFRPVALQRKKPQWKGKVEKPFQHVEGHCLNAREFRDLQHLNDHAAWWLDHVSDTHTHKRTRERPIDRFAREVDHLLPLPGHAYDTAEVGYRIVDREGFVAWDTVQYGVPFAYLLDLVVVRATADEIIVYGHDLQPIVRHERRPRGHPEPVTDRTIHPERRKRRDIDALIARMGELGEAAAAFAAGVSRRQRTRGEHLAAVLALQERYALDDLDAAFERAVRYGAFDAGVVTRILAANATPRVLPDTLAEAARRRLREDFAHVAVAPRDMSDFAAAIRGEDPDEE
jgi:transposase